MTHHLPPAARDFHALACRRAFLRASGVGAGAAALALLEGGRSPGAAIEPGAVRPVVPRVHPALPGLPHHAPRAKSLIYIHPNGGPSQIDLWDHKPGLKAHFEPNIPYTHPSDWLHLSSLLVETYIRRVE